MLHIRSALSHAAASTAVMLACFVLASSAGCGGSDSDGPSGKTTLTSSTVAPRTAKEALQQMVATYREAVTYTDQGVARVHYKVDGQPTEQKFPFSVSFAQPNLLWLKAYEGEIVSDGQRICALHEGVRGYIRTARAPAKLTIGKVYGDEFLWSMLNERQVGGPLQMELIFNNKFLDSLLSSATGDGELLEPAKLDGQSHYRVKLPFPQGAMTFWISQQTGLLRRVEYPTDELRRMLEQQGKVTELIVTADFVGAKVNEPLDKSAFTFESPSGAKEVKQFVGPGPAEVMGSKPAEFSFASLEDGKEITAASLAGKVVVIDFWATWCEFCLKKMPHVAKAYEKYKDNDKVAFLAVSVDQEKVTDEEVKAKLADLSPQLPLARDAKLQDPERNAFKVFQLQGLPTRIILGPDGTVQAGSIGLTPPGVDPVKELSSKIEDLLAGKNLYKEMIAEFEKSMMEEPPEVNEDPNAALTPPEVKIAPESKPEKVTLTAHWTAAEVATPGNLLVAESEDAAPRLFAIDGYRTVLEINPADGKQVARHELEMPEGIAIAYLRTAVDGQGARYFAASAVGQNHVFVFDEQWKQIGSYTAEGTDGGGIGDVQLVDLKGDGTVTLAVGFLRDQGVHLVSLQGEKNWANTDLNDVISLVAKPADESGKRTLLCVHPPGKIAVIDAAGTSGEKITVGQQYLRWLAARTSGSQQVHYAGFGYVAPTTPEGDVTDALVGVDLSGKAAWTYPLPTGQQPWLEQLGFGRVVGDQPHWIAAAADGSLHFVSVDGKPLDRFNVGSALSGFAAVEIDGQRLLLIASGNLLQAWQVQ